MRRMKCGPVDSQPAANAAANGSVDLYYWIEVGRNPAMAAAHPQWMASLGMHNDWQRQHLDVRLPEKGEVAKAFPWVPVTYRETYDAHLLRVKGLLGSRAAAPYAGVLLNDLQGGPSSCGCGNLQCRWATELPRAFYRDATGGGRHRRQVLGGRP
jgi:hypothetical protein